MTKKFTIQASDKSNIFWNFVFNYIVAFSGVLFVLMKVF